MTTPEPYKAFNDRTEIPLDTRDLGPEALDETGRPRVLPASFWEKTTAEERGYFGHRYGIYQFPTIELVDRLIEIIGGRSAIEIGAGNGVLAEALGIPATDSHQQDDPKYKAIYELTKQPTVQYGPNVEKIHASAAVRKYKPQVVIGCWVTHKWSAARPEAGGNEAGVDELDIMAHCQTYVLVGNEHGHRHSRIMQQPRTVEYWDWLYSRTMHSSPNMIAIWNSKVRR